jgi:hypothetical protein
MTKERLIKLIQNLRRGDDLKKSKILFFSEVERNAEKWCKELTLRWLISIIDTYADHGNDIERSNALIVSTFANMIKIADTSLLLTRPDNSKLERLLQDVVYLYDEVNSLKITWDDMPNILFYRISEVMQKTPVIEIYFEEIKKRFRINSNMLKITQHYPKFWDKIFFEGRRHFKLKSNAD